MVQPGPPHLFGGQREARQQVQQHRTSVQHQRPASADRFPDEAPSADCPTRPLPCSASRAHTVQQRAPPRAPRAARFGGGRRPHAPACSHRAAPWSAPAARAARPARAHGGTRRESRGSRRSAAAQCRSAGSAGSRACSPSRTLPAPPAPVPAAEWPHDGRSAFSALGTHAGECARGQEQRPLTSEPSTRISCTLASRRASGLGAAFERERGGGDRNGQRRVGCADGRGPGLTYWMPPSWRPRLELRARATRGLWT